MKTIPFWTLQISLWIAIVAGSKLLKVPRIYNALITTDEELLPSQAYPAVAPVLRPSPPLYLTPQYELPGPPEKIQQAVKPAAPVPEPQQPEVIPWQRLKNNKPSNPEIPDVPPPPLPVTFRQSGKS